MGWVNKDLLKQPSDPIPNQLRSNDDENLRSLAGIATIEQVLGAKASVARADCDAAEAMRVMDACSFKFNGPGLRKRQIAPYRGIANAINDPRI